MRFIGTVDNKTHAERITAYLTTRNISTHCEGDQARWEIWVRDEDQIERASQELEQFLGEPDAPRYRSAREQAVKQSRQKARQQQQARSQQIHMAGDRWNAPIHKVAPLTVTLVVICGVVALMTDFGDDAQGADLSGAGPGIAEPVRGDRHGGHGRSG